MNIRQVILKTANSIEQNPGIYDFLEGKIPPCGSPGCVLGLIGYHAGISVGTGNYAVCQEVFGFTPTGKFYSRMTALDVGDWHGDGKDAAKTLRLYADKYHPEEFKRFHQALIPSDSDYEWNKVAA